MAAETGGFSCFNLQKARPFIWEQEKAKSILSKAQIDQLTKNIYILESKVKDETVARYL